MQQLLDLDLALGEIPDFQRQFEARLDLATPQPVEVGARAADGERDVVVMHVVFHHPGRQVHHFASRVDWVLLSYMHIFSLDIKVCSPD